MFINFKDLNVELQGKSFWVRGYLQSVRAKSKIAFITLRQETATIQAILHESDKVSRPMIKFAASVSKESVVDVFVTLNVPNSPVLSTTQKDVELNVEKFFVVSKALPELPFQVEDAARSDIVVKAEESTSIAHVDGRKLGQGRLKHRRRLRSLSSSSESESSDILKSERSRHKSKHKYKKSHEDKKRHKKKEKQRKKDSKSKKYAVNQDKYGKYGILRESDFHYKSVSFQAWLRDVKKMGEFNGPKWEAMELFKEYMEDYNTCTMPHKKYYDIEKYEMKRYQKKQRKAFANQKETSGKTLDTLADEERLHRELRNAREKKEQEEFRLVLQLMDKDKIEAMREQERIRAQMQLLYKSGNVEEARRLEQILNKVEEDPRFKR
ncbi:unnamed protein product [Peronospora belbahrii]|uniref:OB domain-containing protein n=1 Tax=Peronospora belbahrii TaxID=622444 RepID=A0AAU9KWE3_9STRA|nr:unnamed protein product [Peronospora belbahrii]